MVDRSLRSVGAAGVAGQDRAAPMDLRILGPLEIVVDGRSLRFTAPSQQALLAILLLQANRVVAGWRLIDELWIESRPAKPELALRMAVSRLRRLLAQGDPAGHRARVVTRSGGYVLQAAPDLLDAHRFERLVAEGRSALAEAAPERAALRLDAALALWRGPALASVPTSPLVMAESARLEAARVAALELRVEAGLACGRHLELLPELEARVAAEPLQEGLRRQWMLALYRAGRQADALAAYRDLRQRLVEGLGIEPGPALQRLERQILTADPALMAAAPGTAPAGGAVAATGPPRQLPHGSATFTGRERELARLCQVLSAGGPSASIVIGAVHGGAGIGKSALAIRAAHEVADRFPHGQLYVNLQGSTPGLAPLAPLDALGRMLRTLGLDPTQVPGDVEEAAARFRSLTTGKRLLVVLDDARDARQVRPLLPAGPGCAALLTSRQVLPSLEGAQVLHLDVLPADHAVELLGRIAGPQRIAAEPQAAAVVVGYCGLLPLAIRNAGARLAVRAAWPVRLLAERLTDPSARLDELELAGTGVRASFDVSLRLLEESPDPVDRAAGAAFGLLSLPEGVDLDAPAAARLLSRPEAATRLLLERLADAHLLETSSPGRYQFNDLMLLYAREQVRERYPEAQRLAALTRLFGFYTATSRHALALLRPEEQLPAAAGSPWTDQVDHVDFVDDQAALDWLEAVRPNLLAAVRQVAAVSSGLPPELAIQLTRALTRLSLTRGDWTDAAEANQIALRLARRIGDRTAEADARNHIGRLYWRLQRYQEADAIMRESLAIYEELGDRQGQAEAHRDLGDVLQALGRGCEARTHWLEALAIWEVLKASEAKKVRARLETLAISDSYRPPA